MTLKVLVVDGSLFFQHRLANIINEHNKLEVIGFAGNGREAINKVVELAPDIVTMDYEMPIMDGVTAIRSIMSCHPLPILMLSSTAFPESKMTFGH